MTDPELAAVPNDHLHEVKDHDTERRNTTQTIEHRKCGFGSTTQG
jgi:hypothetical protein